MPRLSKPPTVQRFPNVGQRLLLVVRPWVPGYWRDSARIESAATPAAGLEALMGTKNKGGKGTKTPAAKSLKEKRLAKKGKREAAAAKSST